MLEAKTKYSKSTNIADVNSFLQEADPKNFTSLTTGKSKGVQNKVKNFYTIKELNSLVNYIRPLLAIMLKHYMLETTS